MEEEKNAKKVSRRTQRANANYDEVRTRRTQDHINESLSINYVERFVFECGHTSDPTTDYGYDRIIGFYDEQGFYENGNVYIQIKAVVELPLLEDDRTISYTLERKYINTWRGNHFTVIFVLYDASNKRAYWIHINPIISEVDRKDIPKTQKHITLHLFKSHSLGHETVKTWKNLRDDAVKRINQAFADIDWESIGSDNKH